MSPVTQHAFKFSNGRGQTLAGVLERPEGPAWAYGVFGPCFTCLKESHGAVKISRALAARGIGMLRFDVTGVGQSEGVIEQTNFTTRVQDLVGACAAMAGQGLPPALLVGHSISGTAALSAAISVPSVRCVATVGSPADPAAVVEKFRRQGTMTENAQGATIDVLGKPYRFGPDFVPDMLAYPTARDTAALSAKLFIFHPPADKIVAAENAGAIAGRAGAAARAEVHMLDPASTHLFEGAQGTKDAEDIADVLSAWLGGAG